MHTHITARNRASRRAPHLRAGRSRLTAPRLRDRRHDGPVWQVAWAHPKFGTLLASCSFPQHGRDGLAAARAATHHSRSPPAYSRLLPLGPRREPSPGRGCLPRRGCCGALVPAQSRRFRRPLNRLGTTVRSSCGRSTRRASGGRCTSAASTRVPSTRSHGALWSTASAWRAPPPMAA